MSLRISAGLPTGMEGLTYPIPFSEPETIIRMPGGGGLGNPRKRAVAAVADDVRLGFISADAAKRDYGVAVNDDGSVNESETSKLRAIAAE